MAIIPHLLKSKLAVSEDHFCKYDRLYERHCVMEMIQMAKISKKKKLVATNIIHVLANFLDCCYYFFFKFTNRCCRSYKLMTPNFIRRNFTWLKASCLPWPYQNKTSVYTLEMKFQVNWLVTRKLANMFKVLDVIDINKQAIKTHCKWIK